MQKIGRTLIGGQVISVRLDANVVQALDAIVERMRQACPGARVTRSDAIRMATTAYVSPAAK